MQVNTRYQCHIEFLGGNVCVMCDAVVVMVMIDGSDSCRIVKRSLLVLLVLVLVHLVH